MDILQTQAFLFMSCLGLVHCPACNGTCYEVAAALDTESTRRFLEFDRIKYGGLMSGWLDKTPPEILGCSTCGHCWYRNEPQFEQLERMYAISKPLRSDVVFSRAPTVFLLSEMVRLYRLVGKPQPLLLDYGSGYGRWARAGVKAGFNVCAFEPSKARGEEKNVPFELVHNLDELRGRVFDLVNLEQVLEHVSNPFTLLASIRAYCHPGTVVRITVPNILRCEEANRIWKDWPFDGQRAHIMAPFEHLHGFTPKSLRQLVRRAGYAPVAVTRLLRHYPKLTVRHWLGHWIPSVDTTFLIIQPCCVKTP